jgi:hypothetical protein
VEEQARLHKRAAVVMVQHLVRGLLEQKIPGVVAVVAL